MAARYFYGWNMVGATFVMALFSFGLGFYGFSAYVAMLQRLNGWSASAVSVPVTVYYVAGALLTASAGDLYERFGPRLVVVGGSVAMAACLAALAGFGSVRRFNEAMQRTLGHSDVPHASCGDPRGRRRRECLSRDDTGRSAGGTIRCQCYCSART